MSQNLIVIDHARKLCRLEEYLRDKEFVAFDIETTGLNKGSEVIGFSISADEETAYYVILKAWNPTISSLVEIIDNISAKSALTSLVGKKLICHNGIFDCSMISNVFDISLIESLHTDTMILAHLLNENRRVGLKDLAKEYFGEDSSKEQAEMKASVIENGGNLTKTQYEMYKADLYLMAKYGAKDALLTYKLFLQLVPELYDHGLDKFFYEDESMPLLKGPTYELNTTGLKVDQEALTKLKKQLEAECLEAKDFIYSEINSHIKTIYPGTTKKNTFNIGASQQLAWLLFDIYELEFGTLTNGGKMICKELGLKLPYTWKNKQDFIEIVKQRMGQTYAAEGMVNGKKVRAKKIKSPWSYIAVDKKILGKLAPKYKWIEKLLEYQRKTKILNTYVAGIEERVSYGIINPSFLQTGTTSGRYSSRNPNWQNLPREDQRVKQCIVARPGKLFVSADFSQLEPRIFSYYSKDERLMKAFDGTTDFYSVVGAEVYDKSDCTLQKEGSPNAFGIKYKRLRDLSKVIALATAYGATAHQLAPTTGKSIDDTQEDINKYLERFPGVKTMMLEAHELAKKNGQVTNLFGRPRRMPEAKKIDKLYGKLPHNELPYEARNVLNLACNHRIQSTGASICNRAMISFRNKIKESGIDCKIVSQVHDEIIAECEESRAEDVVLLLQYCMEETTILDGVKLEAIPRITKNLAK